MDVVGSEIGQKMRSAIKAKLTELGCYVDDELPDYVMVMVANKRTRAQMEDDLQLFLGDNTELFVNWLHQVLKKLQEVTVTTPLKVGEIEKSKERSESKERKSKERKSKDKEKVKKSDVKKAKKKDKEKIHRKKEEKKPHKSKKKSKHHEMIRPNIPPLLMNIEKESEPSITDVFAGQILKNHGITLDMTKDDSMQEKKPIIQEIKRPILPIIDPATITSQSDPEVIEDQTTIIDVSAATTDAPKEVEINDINKIEAKIQGLKQKLAEQLDSMSDDEDFLNIRTEAEELMNDFAEDVFQEISQQAPPSASPPTQRCPTPPPPPVPKPIEVPPEPVKEAPETLPQIELKLPKRPIRERLGTREAPKKLPEMKDKEPIPRIETPERFTPEREPEFRPAKSARSRLGEPPDLPKRHSVSDDAASEKTDLSNKRLNSKVSVLEGRPSRSTCASVVRVRPRPRVGAPASNLLLKAVADAHKSLLNAPAKVDTEPQKIKRALVLPMRRCVDAQKIVIQVPGGDNSLAETGDSISLGDGESDDDKSFKVASDADKDEYTPSSITKKITNNDYMPSRRNEGRTSTKKDDTLIIETINIHNPTVDKDKNTQFIVTMDGFSPNAFLAKKLLTEGLLNEDDDVSKPATNTEIPVPKPKEKDTPNTPQVVTENVLEKRLSNTSDESETQVIIKKEEDLVEKRKSIELSVKDEVPPVKKRKASPIVFDVGKKEKEVERVRERTESASSDNHVIVTTAPTHKYDAVPPLSAAERKLVWCRAFPLCRYGAACAFAHPRCKFAAACTRRGCVYSHSPADTPAPPSVASHVVPAANYKSISAVPNLCKYYPSCVNPVCHYYHPKPCRYGKACINKHECNFYHADAPHTKWRYPV